MRAKSNTPGSALRVALIAATLMFAGCDAANEVADRIDDIGNDGSCIYIAGSQLDAAVDFLQDNAGKIHLVTIDIGGNDFRDADCIGATVVGMNYYNPYLSSWLEDAAGQTLAVESAQAATILNGLLGTTYATAGMPMADVAAAFKSDDFVTIVPTTLPAPNDNLPLSVANICDFTYQCDPDPVGPDIHANTAGYALIAETLEAVLP